MPERDKELGLAGVRAAIVAEKSGNAEGAKGQQGSKNHERKKPRRKTGKSSKIRYDPRPSATMRTAWKKSS